MRAKENMGNSSDFAVRAIDKDAMKPWGKGKRSVVAVLRRTSQSPVSVVLSAVLP
jgi:hypothetical protein